MRGCVPGPILSQGHLGHLGHSYRSGPITDQCHLGHSDHVDHSLTLRPWTIWHHNGKCWRIVNSYLWRTVHSDHIRHEDKHWWTLHSDNWSKFYSNHWLPVNSDHLCHEDERWQAVHSYQVAHVAPIRRHKYEGWTAHHSILYSSLIY